MNYFPTWVFIDTGRIETNAMGTKCRVWERRNVKEKDVWGEVWTRIQPPQLFWFPRVTRFVGTLKEFEKLSPHHQVETAALFISYLKRKRNET